jgi:hypothetical protein
MPATNEEKIEFASGFMPQLHSALKNAIAEKKWTHKVRDAAPDGRHAFWFGIGAIRVEVRLTPETVNEPPATLIIQLSAYSGAR